MARLSLLIIAALFISSEASAGRNNFEFKLGAFSNVPGAAQNSYETEATALKGSKEKREQLREDAKNNEDFFSRTAESGVVSIVTQRIETTDSGEAVSGNEIIRWSTVGGTRTVQFIDAATGVVRRTISFSV